MDRDAAGETVANRIDGARFYRADISSENDVRDAMARAETDLGGIDILVNNAAVFVLKGLDATPKSGVSRSTSTSSDVALHTLRRRIDEKARRRRDRQLELDLRLRRPARVSNLQCDQAALVNMTRCMALDLAPHNIRVNCVCPGTIRTSATDRHIEQTGETEEEFLAENAPMYLLNRVGTPREVAYAILFLASDEASFITATPLMVDGGYTAR